MFQTSGDVNASAMKASMAEAEKNYVIQPNDWLDVRVYTNKGERIIDPNLELLREMGQQQMMREEKPLYLVQQDGRAKLPMVDYVKLSGLTLIQADSLLQTLYAVYYVDPFVVTRIQNYRVFVLGSTGGKVIPLANENMNLVEVLALAGGIGADGKAHNIRLIRGDLKEPMVQVVDLSTIDGMRKASLTVEPNDIVYVEPVRRPVPELLRDALPILTIISTTASIVTTTILVINSLKD